MGCPAAGARPQAGVLGFLSHGGETTVSPAGFGQKDAANGLLPTMSPTGSERLNNSTVRELFRQAATERQLVPILDLVA